MLSVINNVGIPARSYTKPERILTRDREGDVRFQGVLVAYSSVDSKIVSAFERIDFNGKNMQGYPNVLYDSTKTYIEVCCYENLETGDIYDELRLIDSSYFTGSPHGQCYAKIAGLSDLLNSD